MLSLGSTLVSGLGSHLGSVAEFIDLFHELFRLIERQGQRTEGRKPNPVTSAMMDEHDVSISLHHIDGV